MTGNADPKIVLFFTVAGEVQGGSLSILKFEIFIYMLNYSSQWGTYNVDKHRYIKKSLNLTYQSISGYNGEEQ